MSPRRVKRRRKWIRQRSAKTIANLPRRHAAVGVAEGRAAGRCEAETGVPEVRCGGPLDPHELVPRSAWHDGQYEPGNIVMVCRRHHDWIGDHPAAAHERGLHRFSWERTA